MKYNKIWIASALVIFALSSCVKDEITLPPAVDNSTEGVIDVVASPTEVTIVGMIDYKYRFVWPTMSQKTTKIEITYLDGTETVTKEYTDFTEDAYIVTKVAGTREFILKSYSATGVVSKTAKLNVANKKYIVEEVINVLSHTVNPEGLVNLNFFNSYDSNFDVKVTYPNYLGTQVKTGISISGENLFTVATKDGNQTINVEFKDAEGRVATKAINYTYAYTFEPTITAGFGEAKLVLPSKVASTPKKLKVTYPVVGGGTASKEVLNAAEIIFPAVNSTTTQNVIVEYEDVEGRKLTQPMTYVYTSILSDFTTTAQKSGWTAQVNANQAGDGNGAPGLIDGNSDTFWHTPWSGTIPPWPFTASISFGKEMLLTEVILNIRHNNGTAAPKAFDVQTSTDGVNYTTHQSFTNTSSTAKAIVRFPLTTRLKTKFVRLSFKNGFNATYLSLGEISFAGYDK